MLCIRTQDKTTLIRSYEIYIAEYNKNYVIRAKRTSHILGVYKTFERAIEILDEIQEKIECDLDYKLSTIYEMPEE